MLAQNCSLELQCQGAVAQITKVSGVLSRCVYLRKIYHKLQPLEVVFCRLEFKTNLAYIIFILIHLLSIYYVLGVLNKQKWTSYLLRFQFGIEDKLITIKSVTHMRYT